MAWCSGGRSATRHVLSSATARSLSTSCNTAAVRCSTPFLSNLVKIVSGRGFASASLPPPLTVPLPDLPPAQYPEVTPKHAFGGTQVATLGNGLRVVTEPKFGTCCTLGVVIEAGCRFEAPYPSGVCHFLEKLAYNSTTSVPHASDIVSRFERHGGVWDAQSSRDMFIYAANAHASFDGVHDVLGLIADAALRPRITQAELSTARNVVQCDVEDSHERPDCETLLTDWIHAAAFRNNTLGMPKLCPLENLERIDRSTLLTYLASHYTPERMVVVGVGCDHEMLVSAASQHFVDTPSIWQSERVEPAAGVDQSVAQYTGGEVRIARDLSHIGAGTPYPHLAHLVVGLQSCSFHDADYIPFCVMNALMGGGCHFSSGGPGKGMYTKLYTHLLNLQHWIYNATSYNHAYADDGLYCIHASCPPDKMRHLVRLIMDQLLHIPFQLSDGDVARARAQLKSLLLMNLEMRPVQFEDTARMIVGLGYRKSPMEFIDEIDAVRLSDIERVCDRMLSQSRPALVAYGQIGEAADAAVPPYDVFDECVARRSLHVFDTEKSGIGHKLWSFWSDSKA